MRFASPSVRSAFLSPRNTILNSSDLAAISFKSLRKMQKATPPILCREAGPCTAVLVQLSLGHLSHGGSISPSKPSLVSTFRLLMPFFYCMLHSVLYEVKTKPMRFRLRVLFIGFESGIIQDSVGLQFRSSFIGSENQRPKFPNQNHFRPPHWTISILSSDQQWNFKI